MTKSATDLMQEILFSSLVDAVGALRASSKGVPNALLRDLNAIGPNTGFADLPKDLQASLTASVREAFNRLLKEGYSVSPVRPTPPPPRPAPTHARPSSRPGGDRPRPGGGDRPHRRPRPAGPGGGQGGNQGGK
jgi:hypothetical protein